MPVDHLYMRELHNEKIEKIKENLQAHIRIDLDELIHQLSLLPEAEFLGINSEDIKKLIKAELKGEKP